MAAPAECTVQAEREYGLAEAARLVADVSGLVSPPMVCLKMFELVQSARASADEIGELVALDPNLAARLLRIVNSSFYGFPARIDSISRAVTILGTSDLYNLVLAISAVRSFSKMDAGLVRMETFWHHSVFCALLARRLAKHFRVANADRFFLAGLLHDIGSCVIYSQLSDFAQSMRAVAQAGEASLCDAECAHLGFSHATVGALVLKQWQLPDELLGAVCYHHDPGAAHTGRVEAAIVHVADAVANQSERGALVANPSSVPQIDEAVWDALETEPESLDMQQILLDVDAAFADTIANLIPAKRR